MAERSAIWTYDLTGDTAVQRLTLEGNNVRPIWTPDGDDITFASDRDGAFSIYRQRADGSGVAERLTTADDGTSHWPEAWSPDGSTLAFRIETHDGNAANTNTNQQDLWTLSLTDGEDPKVLSATPPPSVSLGASFSPDGKWLAYAAGDAVSFAIDIYVEPFPATGAKRLTSAGAMPLWSPAGNELFYRPVTVATQR